MIKETGIDCRGKEYKKIELGKAIDKTGEQIGRLTILWRVKILNYDFGKQAFWLCQCECGNLVAVMASRLNQENKRVTKSCGCLQKEKISKLGSSSRADLTGKVINGIEFIQFNSQYKNLHNIKSKNAYWDCKCHCGKFFTANSGEILQNRIISCGCLNSNKSKGEIIIEQILQKNNINYVYDLAFFKDLKFPNGSLGRYDFILLDKNNKPYRIIEFDGIQHYSFDGSFYHNIEEFKKRKQYDKIKNNYALQHHIPLVRIPYTYLNKLSLDLLMSDQFLITQ